MNAPANIETPLAKLREPFPENQISKLPKETRAQIDERKGANGRNVMVFNCATCGGHHHKNAVHLDYVGHAALTDRLLDTDIEWSWEPVSFDANGLPAFDGNNGLWIKLTVAGVTRLGYGAADGKRGGDAVKEIIGDALRNAAMRFGAALDLWHKGDLHTDDGEEGQSQGDSQGAVSPPAKPTGWREPDSVYNCKTALHKGLTTHQAELRRIGDEGVFDDLDGYLTSPEYQEFVKIAGKHAPHYLEGGPPAPDEFVGTFALEQRARDLIALRGNNPAEKETA